jgi:alpha-1,6-mannosyltransferase
MTASQPPARLHVLDLTTLFIDGGSGGGVNTYLTEKARYLSAQPHVEHTIVVPGDRDETTRLHGSRLVRLKSHRLPWNPEHRVLLRLRRVRRLLRDLRPDLVEVDCVSPLGRAAARALPGVPIFGTYHVHLPEFIARPAVARCGGFLARAVERLSWRFVRYCAQPCQRVLITSRDMLRRVHGQFEHLEHVPLGVNTELFRPRPRLVDPDSPRVLLYVGRLSPEKHLEVLLQAFAELCEDRDQDYELRLVGDGPERRRLERLAYGLPVRFYGARAYDDRLAELYAGADVFVNPSPYEAFGLANLEAAASGVPVVAVAQGGPVDVVSPEIGRLAQPFDAGDFAARVREVLGDRDQFGAGRMRVEREYSWRRCFEHLLSIYEVATGRATGAPDETGSEAYPAAFSRTL